MKKRKEKIKLIPFSQLKNKLMKDPVFKKTYDEFDFEFKLIRTLIEVRAKNKLTQKALANRIGVAQSALARFESGRVNPSLSFLNKVTHGLGLELTFKK